MAKRAGLLARTLVEEVPQEIDDEFGEDDALDDGVELKDRQFVTALARGMAILRCWRPGDKFLGNLDIANRTGLPKPTVSRLTYTLTRLGYLDYSPTREKYALGVGVLALGRTYLSGLDVREIARPLLQQLADQTGASVLLGTLDTNKMVVLEVCAGSQPFQLQMQVGDRVPHGTTALGRAYIAALSPAAREAMLARQKRGKGGARVDPQEWERVRAGVEQACADYQKYGFVFSLGDWKPEVFAIGVPLVTDYGAKIYAINVSGPAYSMTRKRLVQEIGPALVTIRDRIAAGLGNSA